MNEGRLEGGRVSTLNKKTLFIVFGIGVFLVYALYAVLVRAPAEYPAGAIIEIERGSSITAASKLLYEKGIIRSAGLFSLLVRLRSPEAGVLSGVYVFSKPENLFSVASRLSSGSTGITPIAVTIPEGSTVREIGAILKERLVAFNDSTFRALAKKDEGYLFPDTYLFLPTVSPEMVLDTMKQTFTKKTEGLVVTEDALIMASLLEKEARQTQTRRMIAGILWKRLEIGMPLQVDAVFGYIYNRATFHPSFADLEIDSPYNTYRHKGLPPTPINNPGLDSIQAALTPIKNPYLFYLTDSAGNIYYGRTFEEHVANRAKAR